MPTPTRLTPRFVERVWGTTKLSPFFEDSDKKIGEVWFTPDGDYPLLVKFIFTLEKLSVQVHPDDTYAGTHEGSRGKTEMWHILDAEPGAQIAVGFRQEVTREQIRSAVADQTIESLLNWVPVATGETYFTPAGIVHALGAGVTLCEIQQNSDVTYRLYDYGRGRELHLEKALDVLDTGSYEGRRDMPVRCDHFITEVIDLTGGARKSAKGDCLLVAVAGSGSIDGDPFRAGEVFHVPKGSGTELSSDAGARVLLVR